MWGIFGKNKEETENKEVRQKREEQMKARQLNNSFEQDILQDIERNYQKMMALQNSFLEEVQLSLESVERTSRQTANVKLFQLPFNIEEPTFDSTSKTIQKSFFSFLFSTWTTLLEKNSANYQLVFSDSSILLKAEVNLDIKIVDGYVKEFLLGNVQAISYEKTYDQNFSKFKQFFAERFGKNPQMDKIYQEFTTFSRSKLINTLKEKLRSILSQKRNPEESYLKMLFFPEEFKGVLSKFNEIHEELEELNKQFNISIQKVQGILKEKVECKYDNEDNTPNPFSILKTYISEIGVRFRENYNKSINKLGNCLQNEAEAQECNYIVTSMQLEEFFEILNQKRYTQLSLIDQYFEIQDRQIIILFKADIFFLFYRSNDEKKNCEKFLEENQKKRVEKFNILNFMIFENFMKKKLTNPQLMILIQSIHQVVDCQQQLGYDMTSLLFQFNSYNIIPQIPIKEETIKILNEKLSQNIFFFSYLVKPEQFLITDENNKKQKYQFFINQMGTYPAGDCKQLFILIQEKILGRIANIRAFKIYLLFYHLSMHEHYINQITSAFLNEFINWITNKQKQFCDSADEHIKEMQNQIKVSDQKQYNRIIQNIKIYDIALQDMRNKMRTENQLLIIKFQNDVISFAKIISGQVEVMHILATEDQKVYIREVLLEQKYIIRNQIQIEIQSEVYVPLIWAYIKLGTPLLFLFPRNKIETLEIHSNIIFNLREAMQQVIQELSLSPQEYLSQSQKIEENKNPQGQNFLFQTQQIPQNPNQKQLKQEHQYQQQKQSSGQVQQSPSFNEDQRNQQNQILVNTTPTKQDYQQNSSSKQGERQPQVNMQNNNPREANTTPARTRQQNSSSKQEEKPPQANAQYNYKYESTSQQQNVQQQQQSGSRRK